MDVKDKDPMYTEYNAKFPLDYAFFHEFCESIYF